MNVLWFIMGLIIGAALTVLVIACSALSSRIAENEAQNCANVNNQTESDSTEQN